MSQGPLAPALLSPTWPPDEVASGVVSYVADIVEGLRHQGHRPCVLTQSVQGRLAAGHGDTTLIDLSTFRGRPTLTKRLTDRIIRDVAPQLHLDQTVCRAVIRGMRQAVDERGVQLLEMEEAYGWPLLVKPRIRVPLVVRLHGPWFVNGPLRGAPEDATFRRRVRRERLAIEQADGITAPSRDVLDRTRAYYGLPLEAAEVIENPGPVVPPERRWQPDDHNRSTVLFIGRFDRHKGGDVLIDAFARVASRHADVRLVFIGPDFGLTDDEGQAWTLPEYLKQRAGELLAAGRIEWRGQRPRSEAAAARLQAAITVVASRYETFGIAVTEAMAQGCPLVATRTGAIPEIVEENRTGLLCRPGDSEDLAAAIGRLLDAPDLAARLGASAAQEAERRYHPDAIARRMAEFYRRVIDGSESQRRGA